MNKLLLTGLYSCISIMSWSQQNTVSSGGEATGTGGTASYSVGQIDYSNTTGSNGNINQGVQQPFEFFLVNLDEETFANVQLFPNPTNDFIILQIENITDYEKFVLLDVNGKLIAEGNIETLETHIDMRELANGQYHLTIQNSNNDIQSIKIIKN